MQVLANNTKKNRMSMYQSFCKQIASYKAVGMHIQAENNTSVQTIPDPTPFPFPHEESKEVIITNKCL